METLEPQINPCRRCSASDGTALLRRGEHTWVTCGVHTGPSRLTRAGAIEAWNEENPIKKENNQ